MTTTRKKGEINMLPNMLRITVADLVRDDEEWPPTGAIQYLEWFAEKIESIPPEHRATAQIEISSINQWDEKDSDPRILIFYTRLETDEEMAIRDGKERLKQEERIAADLRTLASLKARYES